MLDSLGRYNSCCLMFSQSALEIDCAFFYCVFTTIVFENSVFLCICSVCIWYFCVSLYLQQFYLESLCVFVFATIVFGNDTGSLPALAFDCRAAASSVDGTPEKKINVSASRGSIQDLKRREAKYRWQNYRKISCTKSTVKQRQDPRVEMPNIIKREVIGKI